jgi:hypothetical protein
MLFQWEGKSVRLLAYVRLHNMQASSSLYVDRNGREVLDQQEHKA